MIGKNLVIAIDGYSSCGKSTVARALARQLNYTYIDSGAMYRAITLYCLENQLIHGNEIDTDELRTKIPDIRIDFIYNPEKGAAETFLNGTNVEEAIRQIDVSNLVSPVSKLDFVREAMVDLQRKMSEGKGVVMDGRDIGTVVFPAADLKIFMTADPEVRAKRRFDELVAKGLPVNMDEIRENISSRDYIDSHRDISPLRQAEDALLLDNSYLTREEQLNWILEQIRIRFN